MLIEILTDDCLELIFTSGGVCPFTICTVSQVCRRWHALVRRPSVWRSLVLDKPSLTRYYRRFLVSPYWKEQLAAVRHLNIFKPYERNRHSHIARLPLAMYLSNVQHISTLHLCLAEIAMLLPQLARLRTVQCLAIETWCAAQALDLAILLGPQSSSSSSSSRHVEFQFKDVTGFTSMSVSRAFDTAPQIETLRVINLRDEDYIYVYKVLNEIATAQDSDEEDEERRQQNAVQMMRQWRVIEDRLVSKYKWIASMAHISSFTFGFCYVWTAAVWREALLPICPNLKHLELHGWSQLGSIPGTNQIMDIRRDSEDAMAACFAAATRLRSLVLVDFPISSITSKTLSATHVRIAYSKNWSEPVVVEELHEFLESLHNTQEVILDVPMQQPFRSTIDSQFRHPLLKMKLYS